MYAECEAARAKARDALRQMVVAQVEMMIAAATPAADGYLIAMAVTEREREAVEAMIEDVRQDYAARYPEETDEVLLRNVAVNQ